MTVVPIYRAGASHPQAAVCAACEVRGTALFGALDVEGLDRIHTHIAGLEFAADETLYHSGAQAQAIFTIRAGVVRFERFNERGERRIVRLAGRGDLIGLEALLQRAHQDDAVACTPVQACRIPTALVHDLGSSQQLLQRELMLRWQLALDQSESWLAHLAFGPARGRMLRLLQRLAGFADPQGNVWLPRRDEMGAMLDMTLETASRQVSQMRREGVLTVLPKRGARLDREALQRALQAEEQG
jgi:CRP/FNR family transcriptional regulator, anaerobic regulatory protein